MSNQTKDKQDHQKKQAAKEAVAYLKKNRVDTLGVGTGSTVDFFIEELADSKLQFESVIASSKRSEERLRRHNIQVSDANTVSDIDVYVDGTDECTAHRTLIKGGGGALTGEKILASMAKTFICIADGSKLVPLLGSHAVAIEVIPMARSAVSRRVLQMGGTPVYRSGFSSDAGQVIIDVHFGEIIEPQSLEEQLNQIPGVICNGLFARRGADIIFIAHHDSMQTLSD